MHDLSLCVYWKDRPLTLQDFSGKIGRFLSKIKSLNAEFEEISWAGNAPDTEIRIGADHNNLSSIIFDAARNSNCTYTNTNQDGTPSWNSVSSFGYMISFIIQDMTKTFTAELRVTAGISNKRLRNSVILNIRVEKGNAARRQKLITHAWNHDMFLALIQFWEPENGKVLSMEFAEKVAPDELTKVGWLTYIKNTNASAMRNNPDLIAAGIEMEPVSIGGTLFSIDREMVSPDNEVQVARAKLLRAKLMENHLIDS